MTRGNQRENDRAKAQARAAKFATKPKESNSAAQAKAGSTAEVMREKQRLADLKKAGIDPSTVEESSGAAYILEEEKEEKVVEKKEEFEESLRQSAVREVKSGSSLFGASKNIFETALTKDTAKSLSLMERKRQMKLSMNSMIDDLNEPDFTRFESTMIEFNLSK